MKAGAIYKYDLSIPLENLYNIVEEMRSRLGKKLYIYFIFLCTILLVISQWCIVEHHGYYNFV